MEPGGLHHINGGPWRLRKPPRNLLLKTLNAKTLIAAGHLLSLGIQSCLIFYVCMHVSAKERANPIR